MKDIITTDKVIEKWKGIVQADLGINGTSNHCAYCEVYGCDGDNTNLCPIIKATGQDCCDNGWTKWAMATEWGKYSNTKSKVLANHFLSKLYEVRLELINQYWRS